MLAALKAGSTLISMPKFTPESYIQVIKTLKVCISAAVRIMIDKHLYKCRFPYNSHPFIIDSVIFVMTSKKYISKSINTSKDKYMSNENSKPSHDYKSLCKTINKFICRHKNILHLITDHILTTKFVTFFIYKIYRLQNKCTCNVNNISNYSTNYDLNTN